MPGFDLNGYGPRNNNMLQLPTLGTPEQVMAGSQPSQIMSGAFADTNIFGELPDMGIADMNLGGAPQGYDPSWFDQLAGWTGKDGVKHSGYGGTALGVASGLTKAWLGMKQYGLAKDQLKQSKRQFNQNYVAQRQATNTQLEDRQHARVSANPNAYESVSSYMDKNRIR